MKTVRYIALCLMVVGCASCKEFPNPFAGERVLASVGDKKLYMKDVESIFAPGIGGQDSIRVLESYVDLWIKKQLKAQEAEKLFRDSQRDIEKMVEDYRHSLLNFRLDQYYIDRLLDTVITDDAVVAYYNAHRSDFVLDRDVVQGEVVKVPATYRQYAKLKELMGSQRPSDRYDFLDIVRKNDFELRSFTDWTDMTDFVAALPVGRKQVEDQLSKKGVHEALQGGDRYFYRVTDVRHAGDVAPLERAAAAIRRVLYNQRKAEVVRYYEDSLYEAAVRDHKVTVHL